MGSRLPASCSLLCILPVVFLATAWNGAAPAPLSPAVWLGVAGVVALSFGLGAYLIGVVTASGAVSGVVLGYVVLVAGGVGWFIVLGVFVVLGGITTAYGYEEKKQMGIAEPDGRGFSNVAANGTVAFVAALVYAVVPSASTVAAAVFVGSVATAAADTVSSEVGSVVGEPRLITTLESVPSGTDGGVSLEGEVVAVVAAAVVSTAAFVLGVVSPFAAVTGFVGGLVGVHVDSLLGATIEGELVGNEAVNFLACVSGGFVAGAGVLVV